MATPLPIHSDSDVYIPKPKLQVMNDYTVDTEVKLGIDIVLPLNNEFTLLWFKDGYFVCDLILFGRRIINYERTKI